MTRILIEVPLSFTFIAKQFKTDSVLAFKAVPVNGRKAPQDIVVIGLPAGARLGRKLRQFSVEPEGIRVGTEKNLLLLGSGPVLVKERVEFCGGIGVD